jgi:hypothetical protein
VFVFDDAGATGRRAVAGVVVSVLVVVGGVAAWWFRPAAKATITSGNGSYQCAILGSDPAEEARGLEICRRQAADAARRAPRPSQDPMDPEVMRIFNAVFVATCDADPGWTCDAPRPANTADVTAVRVVLTGLGYPAAVVRLERAGDPAPDGSVVYAVRLPGDRCVVAFAAMGRGPNMNGVSGLLPSGECLTN